MRKATYGLCHRCQGAIAIPGLEAFKCSGACGWVPRLRQSEPKPSEAKEIQVISFIATPKAEPKQLELMGKGGER